MNDKLQAAIDRGTQAYLERENRAAEALLQKRRLEQLAYAESVERWKRRLAENDYIYDRVEEAVAKGETSFELNAGPSAADAVRSFPGLRALHQHHRGHINSDEVKERWETVTVTWYLDKEAS